jgi:hypothetical protein
MEFDFTTAQTVTGFTLAQVVAEMQKPLPASAYKPVPGATDLTDIDPAYLTEVATKVFGPIGLGWWYDFRPGDLAISAEARTAKSGREYTVFTASLHKLSVQYRLLDAAGHVLVSEPITATGGNDNEVESYAVRGALTNAIGAAFAKLTWQLPVYKGQLSHRNAATFGENGNGAGKKAASKPVVTKPVAADQPATTVPAESVAVPSGDLGQFVITMGKHAGKKFAEVSSQNIEWYANSMHATSPAGEELKAAAKAYLAQIAGEGVPA